MNKRRLRLSRYGPCSLVLAILLVLLLVACGTAAEEPAAPAAEPAAPAAAAPQASTGSAVQPTPVAESAPAPEPAEPTSAKDHLTFVMPEQPGSMDPWGTSCTAVIYTAVCDTIVNEPMTWITSDTYEVVTLSGVDS